MLTCLLLWLAFVPPRRPVTRYLLGIVLLASSVLRQVVPRWGPIAMSWSKRAPKVAEQGLAEFRLKITLNPGDTKECVNFQIK